MAEKRNWTPEQQQVIRLRDRNILVSAAAGSGKTAVLVERIIQKILDPIRPVDVDRLLVVTFTRAAAAEMRERIGNALEARLAEEQSERLISQVSLLHSAQISTIDSFCKKVVEEHFHDINLDPVFRVADEAELLLMKTDLCSQLLEDYYEEDRPEFRAFAESYAAGRRDDALESMILQLYGFAESYPDPDGWLLEQSRIYRGDVGQQRFDEVLMQLVDQSLRASLLLNDQALAICRSPQGPAAYEETVLADRELLEELESLIRNKAEDRYERIREMFAELKFPALSRKRQPDADEEKKERVKGLRDQMKKFIQELRDDYFYQSQEELQEDYERTIPGVLMLLELTLKFRERFQKKKKKNNLVDFSDLEHLALQILVDPEGRPTAAAREYRDFYEEILIDEYQDSNRIQEVLLTSISKEALGEPNRFMVGDVKQSIYKFRQARPELFMEKYENYGKAETEEEEAGCLYQKIDLHKNFRSRAEVLDVTNRVFRQIMHRSLGGVEYDDDAALYLGASYPEIPAEERGRVEPEILLLDTYVSEDTHFLHDLEEVGTKEKEALMLVGKIRELKAQGYSYGDMVILLRTMSGWSDVFLRILTSEGIPAVCETSTGYFSAWEIQVMLNVLRVLDNPRQDIPLASVLLSPIGGLTPEQVAEFRILADCREKSRRKRPGALYEALLTAAEESDQAKHFLDWLGEWRRRLIYTPVHQLIRELLAETGFLRHASAMPGGRVRVANLEMLVQRAQSFEQTSYHGVFHFVRYIERLQKYEVDYGEAGMGADEEDVVRIMSIHKSKGLEFPVVMVAGMSKKFNQQDARSTVVLHPELGIGVDFVDLTLRQKGPTLTKRVIQRKILLDNIGEELRVLYVAFTRAREKLILSGTVKDYYKQINNWQYTTLCDQNLMKCNCYFDMIMPAVLQDTEGDEAKFRLQLHTMFDLFLSEGEEVQEQQERQELLAQMPGEGENSGAEHREQIRRELTWQYPYRAWQGMKGKITVSELKRLHLEEEEAGQAMFPEAFPVDGEDRETGAEPVDWTPTLPDFAREEQKMEGATRGTLYHRIMEKLAWQQFSLGDQSVSGKVLEQEFMGFLDQMQASGQLSEEERQALNVRKFVRFLQDPLAVRMYRAETEHKLHRESPFVLGLPAAGVYKEVQDEAAAREIILVQGIIDAWLEEEDGLVLVDYKTDLVGTAGAQLLIDRYQTQLDYYRQALEQLTGRPVKEALIYSFALGQSIRVLG